MADITQNLAITATWTEISDAMSLENGKTYTVEVNRATGRAIVEWAETDSPTQAPSETLAAHRLALGTVSSQVDARGYKRRDGAHLWMRVAGGHRPGVVPGATVVVTENAS